MAEKSTGFDWGKLASGLTYGARGLSSLAQASMAGAGADLQASAIEQQGEFGYQQGKFNARMARLRSADARARGRKESNRALIGGRAVQGAQRVALASQGVDVGIGSAFDVLRETANAARADAETIKNNAWREAWGYDVQAVESDLGAEFARLGAQTSAQATRIRGSLESTNLALGAVDSFASLMGVFAK